MVRVSIIRVLRRQTKLFLAAVALIVVLIAMLAIMRAIPGVSEAVFLPGLSAIQFLRQSDDRFAAYWLAALILLPLAFLLYILWAESYKTKLIEVKQARVQEILDSCVGDLNFLLDGMSDGFVAVDGKGRIEQWNKQAECIFGWSRKEALGKSLACLLVRPGDLEQFNSLLDTLLHKGDSPLIGTAIETRAVHHTGLEVPVVVSPTYLPDGQELRLCAFVRDLSGHVAGQSLARERQSRFFGQLASELRGHLHALASLSDFALSEFTDKAQLELAEITQASTGNLTNTVNDIYDYSQLARGELTLEATSFNLAVLVEDAARQLSSAAHQKALSLATFVSPDIPPSLTGDPHRIRQILINLLELGVEDTDSGEVAVIATLQNLEEGVATVGFAVADTSAGLDKDSGQFLLEPFAAGAPASQNVGAGLRLALSRSLVRLMGAELTANNTPGEGTTYSFTLSLKQSPECSGAWRSPTSLAGVRTLIIGGMSASVKAINGYLVARGVICKSASKSSEVLDAIDLAGASGMPYDLIIFDAHTAYGDIFTLASHIQHTSSHALSKMLLLSAGNDAQLIRDASHFGFSSCLVKPLFRDVLLRTVSVLLNKEVEDDDKEQDIVSVHPLTRLPYRGNLVLVVDQNPLSQKIACLQLAKMGFVTRCVSSGLEALDALSVREYALILMDCAHAGTAGLQAIRLIREQGRSPDEHIPIIALIERVDCYVRGKCIGSGADDCLPKPVTLSSLKEVIDRYVDITLFAPPQPQTKEEPIDFASIREELGQEEQMALLRLYISQGKHLLQEIAALVGERQREHLGDLAGQMADLCMSVKAIELAHLSEELKEEALGSSWETIQDSLKVLKSAFAHSDFVIEKELTASSL